MRRSPTDIEMIIAELLKYNKIKYRREYKIGRFPVDFYLPKYKLSIQCDGSFHHNNCKNCRIQGTHSLPRQVFQARRDKACMIFHRHVGINILRICECRIKGELKLVAEEISRALFDIKSGKSVYRDKDEQY